MSIKRMSRSYLFSPLSLIVTLVVILPFCCSQGYEPFKVDGQILQIAKGHRQRVFGIIDNFSACFANKPQSQSPCLQELASTLQNERPISAGQYIARELQQEKSALVDLEERAKEDASLLCKIIKKKIEISLLQNSENKASLININIAFKLANDQLKDLANNISFCQKKLKDCQKRQCINDCNKCPCPAGKSCEACQESLQTLQGNYDAAKQDNQVLKARISQFQTQSLGWKQTFAQVLPKVKDQVKYAIQSQGITKFDSTKLFSIIDDFSAANTPQNAQNLIKSFTEELLSLVNVTTKSYSKIVDQRNSLLSQAKGILGQLKECNKVLKKEK